MREVVEYLIKNLVDHPESVRVREKRGRGVLVYVVEVEDADRGRVIGRKGRVIEALRTLTRAYARGRVTVEVR